MKVGLGKFVPPLWLLGLGALGAAALCVYIGAGVLDLERRRSDFEEDLAAHQRILAELPGIEQQYSDLEKHLTQMRSQKTALEASIAELREQEKAVRNVLAQRDSAVAERDDARKTLQSFKDEQEKILKEKEQAEKEKKKLSDAVEEEDTKLKGLSEQVKETNTKLNDLSDNVKNKSTELAELQAKTEKQKKLNELLQHEQATLEGFSNRVTKSLEKFKDIMKQEAQAFAEARANVQNEQNQAIKVLNDQSKAFADEAQKFFNQITANQRLVSEVKTGLQTMQSDMAKTSKVMQEVAALPEKLADLQQTLERTGQEIETKKQQVEKSTQELDQENSELQKSRTDLAAAVTLLREILEQMKSSPLKSHEPAVPARDTTPEQN